MGWSGRLIEQVMNLCDRVQIKAAARLGINRNTLHKKIDEFKKDDLTSNAMDEAVDGDEVKE